MTRDRKNLLEIIIALIVFFLLSFAFAGFTDYMEARKVPVKEVQK